MGKLCCRYCNEFTQSELLARKMAYQCAKKISQLLLETEGYNAAAAAAAPSSSSATHLTDSNSGASSRVTTPTKPGTGTKYGTYLILYRYGTYLDPVRSGIR